MKKIQTDVDRAETTKPMMVNTPQELRALPVQALPDVCESLRQNIIQTLSTNPGHFASSMGAVELTVALHYVYQTPYDRIVWDVGHQAYAHKLLTGRAERFHTLRKKGGLSGFPNPRESEYDTFIAGHASNSISAALGMSIASAQMNSDDPSKVVAVIGDASISGGLAFEGLNNASAHNNNLLIVLNDNDMSIDEGVGAMHRYLSRISTSAGYNRMRYRAYNFMKKHRFISEKGRGRILRFTNSVKSLISRRQNIFEGLNIRYFGPIDGHDVKGLVKVLSELKDMQGPRLLHICTVKGKGYEPAERDPASWHAPGEFDPLTGQRKKSGAKAQKWQEIFGHELVKIASEDKSVAGITAAMPSGTSMSMMMERYPERTFDVGISEGHAVTFAGGMASAGMHPYVAIYSSFLQRAYDNIIHDVCIQGLPVTFCIDRAGIVGDDGVTHHGLFDLAYLSVIPGLAIASPMDPDSLRALMRTALKYPGPMAIRYPRGDAPAQGVSHEIPSLTPGKARELSAPADSQVCILSIGPIAEEAVEAIECLKKRGVQVAHYDMIWLKPLDRKLVQSVADRYKTIITLEDASVQGGLGSAVAEILQAQHSSATLYTLGAPCDAWVHHGSVAELRADCGYDAKAIEEIILNLAKQ